MVLLGAHSSWDLNSISSLLQKAESQRVKEKEDWDRQDLRLGTFNPFRLSAAIHPFTAV